jgi:hypothetical protein
MMDAELAVIVTVGNAVTLTVTAAKAWPPDPVAVAVYVVVADGLTDCVPPEDPRVYELPSLPLIVICVAWRTDTVNVDALPALTEVGLAEMFTIGAGLTVTIAVAVVLPPVPVAVAVYVVVAEGLTDCVPPEAAIVYELPSLPLTVTVFALLADTVKVEELPAAIEVGLALMVTVGAGLMVTVADAEAFPPLPLTVAV